MLRSSPTRRSFLAYQQTGITPPQEFYASRLPFDYAELIRAADGYRQAEAYNSVDDYGPPHYRAARATKADKMLRYSRAAGLPRRYAIIRVNMYALISPPQHDRLLMMRRLLLPGMRDVTG